MLKAIHLENFKCFENSGPIPLAPITLIFGPNSAGKSSILQSLYLLMQTRRLGEPQIPLLFRAENGLVDLGSYEEVIHEHDHENQRISIRLDVPFDCPWSVHNSTKEWFENVQASTMGLRLEFKSENSEVSLSGYEMFLDVDEEPFLTFEEDVTDEGRRRARKRFLLKKVSKNGRYWQYLFDRRHELRSPPEADATEEDRQDVEGYLRPFLSKPLSDMANADSISDYVDGFQRLEAVLRCFQEVENQGEEATEWQRNRLQDGSEYFLPGRVCSERDIVERIYPALLDPYSDDDEHSPLPTKFYTKLTELSLLDPIPVMYACAYQIDSVVERLRALGSIHPKPQRWYLFSGTTPTNVGTNGERVPDLLFKDKDTLTSVNDVLDKVLDMGCFIETPTIVSKYGSMFEIRVGNTQNPTGPTVSLADVGFGVGQLLPVVIQALLETHKTILVEQPETHIHPALQARLGTFFAKCVSEQRNQFIIETHSEHLILRLQRLIRNKELAPDQVKVLYVDPAGGKAGPTVREMRMDGQGEFMDDWPGGFFAERLREFLD